MKSSIQISKKTKSLIRSFGTKEETYEDIIKRMYKLAVQKQLRELLISSKGTITIKEAKDRLSKKNLK